jgi:hypothetical protein
MIDGCDRPKERRKEVKLLGMNENCMLEAGIPNLGSTLVGVA